MFFCNFIHLKTIFRSEKKNYLFINISSVNFNLTYYLFDYFCFCAYDFLMEKNKAVIFLMMSLAFGLKASSFHEQDYNGNLNSSRLIPNSSVEEQQIKQQIASLMPEIDASMPKDEHALTPFLETLKQFRVILAKMTSAALHENTENLKTLAILFKNLSQSAVFGPIGSYINLINQETKIDFDGFLPGVNSILDTNPNINSNTQLTFLIREIANQLMQIYNNRYSSNVATSSSDSTRTPGSESGELTSMTYSSSSSSNSSNSGSLEQTINPTAPASLELTSNSSVQEEARLEQTQTPVMVAEEEVAQAEIIKRLVAIVTKYTTTKHIFSGIKLPNGINSTTEMTFEKVKEHYKTFSNFIATIFPKPAPYLTNLLIFINKLYEASGHDQKFSEAGDELVQAIYNLRNAIRNTQLGALGVIFESLPFKSLRNMPDFDSDNKEESTGNSSSTSPQDFVGPNPPAMSTLPPQVESEQQASMDALAPEASEVSGPVNPFLPNFGPEDKREAQLFQNELMSLLPKVAETDQIIQQNIQTAEASTQTDELESDNNKTQLNPTANNTKKIMQNLPTPSRGRVTGSQNSAKQQQKPVAAVAKPVVQPAPRKPALPARPAMPTKPASIPANQGNAYKSPYAQKLRFVDPAKPNPSPVARQKQAEIAKAAADAEKAKMAPIMADLKEALKTGNFHKTPKDGADELKILEEKLDFLKKYHKELKSFASKGGLWDEINDLLNNIETYKNKYKYQNNKKLDNNLTVLIEKLFEQAAEKITKFR